jgi:hypothetical protein
MNLSLGCCCFAVSCLASRTLHCRLIAWYLKPYEDYIQAVIVAQLAVKQAKAGTEVFVTRDFWTHGQPIYDMLSSAYWKQHRCNNFMPSLRLYHLQLLCLQLSRI